jgi:hypothetical protein
MLIFTKHVTSRHIVGRKSVTEHGQASACRNLSIMQDLGTGAAKNVQGYTAQCRDVCLCSWGCGVCASVWVSVCVCTYVSHGLETPQCHSFSFVLQVKLLKSQQSAAPLPGAPSVSSAPGPVPYTGPTSRAPYSADVGGIPFSATMVSTSTFTGVGPAGPSVSGFDSRPVSDGTPSAARLPTQATADPEGLLHQNAEVLKVRWVPVWDCTLVIALSWLEPLVSPVLEPSPPLSLSSVCGCVSPCNNEWACICPSGLTRNVQSI